MAMRYSLKSPDMRIPDHKNLRSGEAQYTPEKKEGEKSLHYVTFL
jgi:hypothetical protein